MPADMQQTGRDHEAGRERDRIRAVGQFAAVRVAVEDREGADQHGRDPQRRPRRERDHQAEDDGRCRNPRLDRRDSGTPRIPSTPPNAITSGNTIGKQPDRGRPEECAP